jgi:hypothetical protein
MPASCGASPLNWICAAWPPQLQKTPAVNGEVPPDSVKKKNLNTRKEDHSNELEAHFYF